MIASSSGPIPDIPIPPGRLLLAFSGGSDSLFLMALLSGCARDRTEAVYVDHAIRPRGELEREISLNRQNARRLGIPLRIVSLGDGRVELLSREKGIGTEAAARSLRYSLLRAIAASEGFDHILTAHHREDQVETVLMRIIQGSPFHTYQGILREDGPVFRPLLTVPKSCILSYLSSSGLSWSEDSTNDDTDYLRNRIRHSLMPFVTETERALISSIAASVAAVRRRFPQIPVVSGYYSLIPREAFLSALPMQREEALYRAFLSAGSDARIPRAFIDEVLRCAERGSGRLERGDSFLYFSRHDIRIFPRLDDFVLPFPCSSLPGGLKLIRVAEDERTLVLDGSLLQMPAVLRTAREGDRIELRDGERKLSEMMKDMRIPYAIVLEDRAGIAAFLSRFAGGNDRLSRRFLDPSRKGSALAIRKE